MYRLGKLVLNFSLKKRSVLCCSTSFPNAKISNTNGHLCMNVSRVVQCSQSHQKTKGLDLLYFQRVNLVKNMSTSINEEFRHLDYHQLIQLKNKPNNIVIDVREKKELDETGVIPGAQHIPLGDIEAALSSPEDEFKRRYNFDKPSTEDSIIFSCRSGKRSLVALETALVKGFKNAKHYRGGWLDWEKNH